jgi:Skp family chaperone for outer membrane proteins
MIAVAFIFTAIFSFAANAQAPVAGGKFGLINTYAFADEKEGIVKYRNALKALDEEFKPISAKIKTMTTKYQTLGTEIQNANKPNPAVPIDQKAIQAKIDEFQQLELQIKREQEDAKVKYDKRSQVVLGPIMADIYNAVSEYATKNGFAAILDGAKLEEQNILIGFDKKYDVTDDFIKYYNARPASSATASKPR